MIKQYYYAGLGCDRTTEEGCWHDESSGPLPEARHHDIEGQLINGLALTWRDKPLQEDKSEDRFLTGWPEPINPSDQPPTIDDADHNRNVQAFHNDIGGWCVHPWDFVREHKLPWYHTPLFFMETDKDLLLREVKDLYQILDSSYMLDSGIKERLERIGKLIEGMKDE